MKKGASEFRWRGGSALVVLALAAAILGLLVLNSSAKAKAPPFPAYATTDISENDCLANADILSTFGVDDTPWPAANYQAQISFTPGDWGVAASADVPIGAVVGKLHADATLGWFNNPCSADYGGLLQLDFDPLMNCSIDTSNTITFDDQLNDDNGNGLPDGCDKYPEYLNTMFPGMTPLTRHAGFERVSGIDLSLNFMTFEPGTDIPDSAAPGVPNLSEDLGYVAMSVLNDPTAPLVKNQITDQCPPLGTETTYYGVTKDHTNTGADESGFAWRTNPQYAGTYVFNGYTHSIRDADNDDIDNELDTCPHIANVGDPRVEYSGDPDGDGLDSACDPTPSTNDDDPDGDGFPNRQDNCPLVDNEDQNDADYDGIGDACDQNDWNDDGDTTDPGEPTGFSPTTPNGDHAVKWFESDVEVMGSSCLEPPTPTPTATATVEASPTGTVAAETPTPGAETPTPTAVGEYCSPVFPGTYNGLVRVNGQPATSGYEVTASIDGVEWGSAIVAGGRYAMDIPDHLPTAPPCFEGGTITFELDGMTCTPTADWASGINDVDLSCAPAAPATPTPTATPPATPPATPTPTVTPAGPPPTGAGGLFGSSSGLPVWAMAVASWAGLMIVAGLGTLVAVKKR
jgi:hypothetical protein